MDRWQVDPASLRWQLAARGKDANDLIREGPFGHSTVHRWLAGRSKWVTDDTQERLLARLSGWPIQLNDPEALLGPSPGPVLRGDWADA